MYVVVSRAIPMAGLLVVVVVVRLMIVSLRVLA